MKVKTIRCPLCKAELTYTVRLGGLSHDDVGRPAVEVRVDTSEIREHVADHKREVPCV